MTKDEIKRELDALGVDYAKESKLAELEALYAPYAPYETPAAVQGAATGEATPPKAAHAPAEIAGGAPASEPGASVEDTAAPDLRTVACSLLNMRDAADGEVLAVARAGAPVEVIDAVDGWAHVTMDAWVRGELLA